MRVSILPHRQFVFRSCVLIVIFSLLTSSVLAAGPTLSVDSVGGKTVSNNEVKGSLKGTVLVQGTAIPSTPDQTTPPPKPLVADAGDSGFAAVGDRVTLLGAGYGGREPYTFAWSTPVGTLEGADAPTAQLITSGIQPGTYTLGLSIRDSAGATAFDTVKVVVFQAQQRTLLDQSKNDALPGVLSAGVPGTILFPFSVPANTARIDVRISWTLPVNDYDLRILDPRGVEANHHGDGVPTTEENASVSNPVAGNWNVAADKFGTVTDTVRAQVQGVVGPADPRPLARANGPYRFAIGATQTLSGTITGGTAPITAGWDTDADGVIDQPGNTVTVSFPAGRRLVTFKATDANGFERREMVSVLVADQSRLAAETTAITVVAVNDSGINPYHLEFSAQTYPDPDVLALTRNFTRHPSEYIPGYPTDSQAINMTLGQGYFPSQDRDLWWLKDAVHPNGLEYGKLYWIPGTKIIGATQPGELSCSNCAAGSHVILDDDGHGSGSASVSTGNRYGYCGSCLLFVEKGLDAGPAASYSWIDISSNSWGARANVPLDMVDQLLGADPGAATRNAVERGQTVLFASGNGAANAFDAPISTYGTSTTGPDWNVVVGAIRRDNGRAIVGDGTPVHLSAWGDGNLPSACRTGTVSQCAFGGTSAATPYTSGIFGTVLTAIRRQIGDNGIGQRPGQVVAEGFPVAASPYLNDGKLRRAELREAVLKTAFPLNQDNAVSVPIFPFPLTAPYNGDINVLFEGYGAATPNSARRAIDVLLGRMPLPVREAEDRFFAIDQQIRDSIWGGYDRNGDSTTDVAAPMGAFQLGLTDVDTPGATLVTIRKVAETLALNGFTQVNGANAYTFYLHRSSEGEPGSTPGCNDPVTYMDQEDSAADWDACFENRATSVLAAYRPLGIWPSTVNTTVPIPAGSNVQVELYLATDQVSVVRPTGVLMAGDREIGTGSATPMPTIGSGPWISQGSPVVVDPLPHGVTIDENKCKELGELCWNKFSWSFTTNRPAIAGEQLTFQVQLIGARAWSFGYEGQHRSLITIIPAALPGTGMDFGVNITSPSGGESLSSGEVVAVGSASFPDLGSTQSGDHPTHKRVDVSINDASFGSPIEATLDESSGAWSVPLGSLSPGNYTLYARAAIDTNNSPVDSVSFTVQAAPVDARVEWQVVPFGSQPGAGNWQPASGLPQYAFQVDTRLYGAGTFQIYVRLLENGVQTAITSVKARFSGN
jgi:hypothetical protein